MNNVLPLINFGITSIDFYLWQKEWKGEIQFINLSFGFISLSLGEESQNSGYYAMSLGIVGKLIPTLKIRRDLETIFFYRRAWLEVLFGVYCEEDVPSFFTS